MIKANTVVLSYSNISGAVADPNWTRTATHAAVMPVHIKEVWEISSNFRKNAYNKMEKNISFLPLISFSCMLFYLCCIFIIAVVLNLDKNYLKQLFWTFENYSGQ